MQTASPGHESNPGHLVYQDGVSNAPSKARLDDDEAKEAGLWSVRGSTNVSLSGGNQVMIPDDLSVRQSMSRYFQARINTEWTDVLLIICGFVSGLVDGLSFNAWGSFSSMQTGMCFIFQDRSNMILTISRQLRLHSPRRLGPTRLPSLSLGQIPHRPRRLFSQQHLLHPILPRPASPPPLHPPPLLQRPNSRPTGRRSARPVGRGRPQTRRSPRPDPMAASPTHLPPRLPSRGPNRRLARASLRRNPHRCLDHLAL